MILTYVQRSEAQPPGKEDGQRGLALSPAKNVTADREAAADLASCRHGNKVQYYRRDGSRTHDLVALAEIMAEPSPNAVITPAASTATTVGLELAR